MGRHGSRWPLSSELVFIKGLQYKLGNASAAIEKAHLPGELKFLKDGYRSTLGANDLTPVGREQMFEHGVKFVSFFRASTAFFDFNLDSA